MPTMRQRRPVPTYVVAIAVVATAGVTGFAMLKAGYPPAWVTNRPYSLAAAPQFWVPWATTNAAGNDAIAVGGLPVSTPSPAPTRALAAIRADVIPAHGDLGVCTGCHAIVDRTGAPLPAIRSYSPQYHEFRGVCGNCHSIVAPNRAALAAAPQPQSPTVPKVAQPAVVPTEGELFGMELSPITQLTATQFSIPAGTQGLVVVEAEGAAALAGMKPGDVLVGLNGYAIRSMSEFLQATRNGTVPSANLELLRGGQRVALTLTAPAPAAAAAKPAPNSPPVPALQVNPIATLAPQAPAKAPSAF